MPIEHLSEFLDVLAERGELVRVSTEVNSQHELAAISRRAALQPGSPALLFENVTGYALPVVVGLFNTALRTCRALGVDSLEEIADRITAVVRPDLPSGWLEALQMVPKLTEVTQWPVQVVETAMVQQVVHMGSDVDLGRLPVPVCWSQESMPTLTATQLFVEESIAAGPGKSPLQNPLQTETGQTIIRHVSRVPVQIVDRNTVLVYWTSHDPEWQLVEKAARQGQQSSLAVALGGDPVLTFAAGAPLPPFVDPLVFAGFLRSRNVNVVSGRSVTTQVPADAEIILEGLVDPSRAFAEASTVATPTGYYDTRERAVRVTITAVTHRANPVLPVIIPAAHPSEDGWLAHASERIFLPLVKLAIPELVDLRLPASGDHRHIAFASIRKSWPQQARKVMNALWGIDRLSCAKLLIVVDERVDIHDNDAVWSAVGANSHPGRDTIFSEGPADMLDHAAPIRGVGHRMGIDATSKSAEEGHPRLWPDALAIDDETSRLVEQRWQNYGIPNGKSV
ncbi:MAG: UbiD family decarboxylase [Planctomycetota bacterium]|nr:UbiD family decarboxylase [Planctomycetota bacterium]